MGTLVKDGNPDPSCLQASAPQIFRIIVLWHLALSLSLSFSLSLFPSSSSAALFFRPPSSPKDEFIFGFPSRNRIIVYHISDLKQRLTKIRGQSSTALLIVLRFEQSAFGKITITEKLVDQMRQGEK
jgi:hypothetical protein